MKINQTLNYLQDQKGDLIWFPLDDRLYEIKDIEYAKPYYQLQDLYTYELICELYHYEDEVIATGIDEIDNNLVGEESDGETDDGISTIQVSLILNSGWNWCYCKLLQEITSVVYRLSPLQIEEEGMERFRQLQYPLLRQQV